MALIKCYECEKEISDKAPACPHCGAPKEGRPSELEENRHCLRRNPHSFK
jgi:hypothetical protein